jgi:hypothetical protein
MGLCYNAMETINSTKNEATSYSLHNNETFILHFKKY